MLKVLRRVAARTSTRESCISAVLTGKAAKEVSVNRLRVEGMDRTPSSLALNKLAGALICTYADGTVAALPVCTAQEVCYSLADALVRPSGVVDKLYCGLAAATMVPQEPL